MKAVNAFYKDFNDYRLWIALAQQKLSTRGGGKVDLEGALDYLRNGIR